MTHPTDSELLRCIHGELPADRQAEVAQHIDACPSCQARLEVLNRSQKTTPELTGDDGHAPRDRVPPRGWLFHPGDTLGTWQIVGRVGWGGMGQVYKATQLFTGRVAALKVISAAGEDQFSSELRTQIEARFRREIYINEQLSGEDRKHFLGVYDAGRIEEVTYLAIEFIPEGRTLQTLFDEGYFRIRYQVQDPGHFACEYDEETDDIVKGEFYPPKTRTIDMINPRLIADYGAKIAAALHAAHKRGIIHRDLKPSNLLIKGNDPILADFGLAKVQSDISSESESTLSHDVLGDEALTRHGTVLGTPAFMPPEQLANPASATPSSDIYSLGMTLFYLCKGRLPTSDPQQELYRIEPDATWQPINFRQEHSILGEIILKCLSVRPEDRYQSALTLSEDLCLCRDGHLGGGPLKSDRGVFDRLLDREAMGGLSPQDAWVQGKISGVNVIAVSPDGRLAAAGCGRWGLDSKGKLLKKHGRPVSIDCTVRVWDIRTGQLLHSLKGHTGPVISLTFTPDGTQVLSGGGSDNPRVFGEIILWDIKTGKEIRRYYRIGDNNAPRSLGISPHAPSFLATADGDALQFDLNSGDVIGDTWIWPSDFMTTRLTCMAFSPDGRFAIMGDEIGALHLVLIHQ